jgi:translocation and assembly module TamA
VLSAVTVVPTARAFDLFGLKLFDDQSDIDAAAVIADPQPYTVTVDAAGAPKTVADAVRSASRLVGGVGAPASGAAGLLATARGDYGRILAALYEEGYYGGAISILVGGREAETLPPDIDLPDPVAVAIRITTGPLFHFGRVAIVNRAGPASEPGDEVEAPELVGYGRGEIARSGVILEAEQLALDAWRQQGYAKAAIADRKVVADHRTNLVDVTIVVAPGGLAHFGTVSVNGTTAIDPEFVAQQTGLVPGAEYDPDDTARAEKRLARLDVFRAMRIEAADSIGSTGLLPFEVIVEDQPQRRLGVGATYSTVDGLGFEAFHLWRNLFGRAERLRLDAKVAGIAFPINTAAFDYAFGGTFTKPGFINPDTDLIAAVSAERTVLPSFTQASVTGRVGVTNYFSDEITLDGALEYERSHFDDAFGVRDFSLAGLTGGLTFDNRDSATDPTTGFYANITAEPFYEFYYGNPVFRTTAELRTYWSPTGDNTFVLAARAKAGGLLGPALSEIPPNRLFFAGGGGSVRGYGYKSIGVPGPGGTVTGGRYLLEGSLEARVKVTTDIGLVGFIDGGYVGGDTLPRLNQLRLGAGVGLRYYTGLGPLRLDLAFRSTSTQAIPTSHSMPGLDRRFETAPRSHAGRVGAARSSADRAGPDDAGRAEGLVRQIRRRAAFHP